MSGFHAESVLPRRVLGGAALLVLIALVATLMARSTGIGRTEMPAAQAVDSRELSFSDRDDGSIAVFLHGGTKPVYSVAPGGDGFARGVLRGFARERKRRGIGSSLPYRLERWVDGRLTISDPSTGRNADLGAFGPANFGAFKRLYDATAPSALAGSDLAALERTPAN